MSGSFRGKLAAAIFNNNIELFEKAEGFFKHQRCQNAAGGLGFFRFLGLRFLGYEGPLETLK